MHEGKKLFRCSICTECFDDGSKMKNHIVSVHEKENLMNSKPKELLCMNLFQKIEKAQPCDKCGDEFDSKRELKAHILSVHEGKKLYRCSICKACFAEGGKMKTHIVNVHGKGNLLHCKPKEILRMNLAHEVENSQVCGQCGDKFDNKRDLKRHHSLVHKGKSSF